MDHASQRAVLLRSAAELFCRSYRVHQYLEKVAPAVGTEYAPLAKTLAEALTEARSNIDTLSHRSGLPEGEFNRQLLDLLGRYASAFANIHETLIYLPSAGVRPEAIGLLKATFGKHYQAVDPSIILGSAFNAFHFDFSKTLGRVLPDLKKIRLPDQKNTVLQNPICDWQSPIGWAVLAHEMGHAIDRIYELSRQVARELSIDGASPQYDWLREFCADILASEMIGPAAILAIVSIEYTLYPLRRIHKPSERTDKRPSHPTTLWRLRVVAEHLAAKYSIDYLGDTLDRYEDAWNASLERFETPENQDIMRHVDSLQYAICAKRFSEAIRKRLTSELTNPHLIAEASVERCLQRLRRGDPIGAQGRPREELQKLITEYREKYEGSSRQGPEKIQAFEKLVAEFREAPLGLQTLLFCCALRRDELIREAVDRSSSADFPIRFENLNESLTVLDSRAVSSLTGNLTQRTL
ncbi:MAG: hypothetical protein MI923_27745 [Phycisphaerales bacterium]|nr:hypothetical protein [Phycisphaerales bacterium]